MPAVKYHKHLSNVQKSSPAMFIPFKQYLVGGLVLRSNYMENADGRKSSLSEKREMAFTEAPEFLWTLVFPQYIDVTPWQVESTAEGVL